MSELISGKEALIALANGEIVEMADSEVGVDWTVISKHGFLDEKKISAPCLPMFFEESENIQFRLKPRTIYLNDIEVPVPFEPKEGVDGYIIDLVVSPVIWDESDPETYRVGVWRNEDEIKQVVAALRSVFNVK